MLLMALVLVFFLPAGHQWKCGINGNAGLKRRLSGIHISFGKRIVGKLMMMAHSIISGLVVKLYHRNGLICFEMILLVARRWIMTEADNDKIEPWHEISKNFIF